MTNTVHALGKEIGGVLAALNEVVQAASGTKHFLNALGWDLPPGVEDIGLAALDFTDFLDKLRAVVRPSRQDAGDELRMAARIAELGLAAAALVDQIDDLAASLPGTLSGFGDYVDRTNIQSELPRRMLDLLLINHLSQRTLLAASILSLLNIIELRYFPADPENFQREHLRAIVHYSHLEELITDPAGHMANAYGWGTAEFSDLALIERIGQVLRQLGLPLRVQLMDPQAEAAVLGLPPLPADATPVPQMIVTLYEQLGEIAGLKLGLSVFGVRPTSPGATDGGLGFLPFARGHVQESLPFFAIDDTFLDISAEGDLLRRLALVLRAGSDLDVRTGAGVSNEITGRFSIGLRHGAPESDPLPLFTLPGGVGFSARQIYLKGGVEKRSDRSPESFLELGLLGARAVLSLDGADAFLEESIPQDRIEATFDARIGWTSEQGIYFHGSSGLTVSLPTHAALGPFSLDSVTLGLKVEDAGLSFESSVSGRLSLGPLLVTVERLGLEIDVSFERGNLGLFGLSPDFKPPTGLGLSIDGGGFKGGGFLRFEPELAQYSGMLELEFQDQLTVKAIGLLNTRLPNGQSGFSLLIVISSEFTPIQLGFGFKLNGVGGLLGLNRTVRIDRLVSGLRDNTLNSILFPTDIIANADRILSDLRQVFPPERGRFVFGPMAKITWGTPALLTADLGLIIEVPDPVRIAILGVVRAVVPSEQAAILRLQVNFLGVIDFEKEQFSFDASLFDSKLLAFTLTGDMAVRLFWGAEANFLLTVGGFHPAYQPPPMNLPALRRLTLALLDGNNPRLTLETYLAVTSNTVQLGARLELYAAAWEFNAYGFLSFDVLFQLNPFSFIAEVTAMLALRVGTSSIASIKLTLTLEGPTPWKARGDARLRLCWFLTVKVRFNKTFGEARNTALPDLTVLPLLVEALSARDNWETEIPVQRHRLESLRELTEPDRLVVHPVGTLKISQKLVPLNLEIDRLGSQRPTDARVFDIADVQIGPDSLVPPAVQESFAPAQLFDMTDQEKLASPSFQSFDSGIRVGDPDRLHTAYAAAREVRYELKYIDSQRDQRLARPGGLFQVDPSAFNTWTLQGATAKSDLSYKRRKKSALAPDEVGINGESFVIVSTVDLKPFDAASVLESEQAALKRREALIAANPELRGTLQIVPAFEMSA